MYSLNRLFHVGVLRLLSSSIVSSLSSSIIGETFEHFISIVFLCKGISIAEAFLTLALFVLFAFDLNFEESDIGSEQVDDLVAWFCELSSNSSQVVRFSYPSCSESPLSFELSMTSGFDWADFESCSASSSLLYRLAPVVLVLLPPLPSLQSNFVILGLLGFTLIFFLALVLLHFVVTICLAFSSLFFLSLFCTRLSLLLLLPAGSSLQ